MATSTTNLGLTKPSVNDAADIGVLNSNFDKIDTKCNPALFAPSGYGLGTYAQLLTADHNLNNLLPTGLYRWGSSVPVNAPSPIGYAVMLHIARTDGDSIQKVWHLGTHSGAQISAERYLSDNKGEWEWTNPPMQLGVEYRTTERHNGKPVYVQAVSFGALPNAAEKLVSYSSKYGNVGGVLCVYGYTSVGITLPYISSYANYRLYASTSAVGIETDADKSSQTAIVIVKYCLA